MRPPDSAALRLSCPRRGGPSPEARVGSLRGGSGLGRGPGARWQPPALPFHPGSAWEHSGSCQRVLPGEQRQQPTGILLDPSSRGRRERGRAGRFPFPPASRLPPALRRGTGSGPCRGASGAGGCPRGYPPHRDVLDKSSPEWE